MHLMDTFRRAWARVRETYESGYMVYESGLQGSLFGALRIELQERRFVLEPRWQVGGETMMPDMVIVSRSKISDIFEMKFFPEWDDAPIGEIERDIEKLLNYEGQQSVRLNPATGEWAPPLPIREDCRRHFVIVAGANSPTVQPQNIPARIIHWYGRVSQEHELCHWAVCQGQQN